MLYRLRENTNIRLAANENEKSAIEDTHNKRISIVNDTGRIFLSVLSHVPQSLDELVKKLLQLFVGVDAETITADAKEFYDKFVNDDYLVSGESCADCNAAEYGWGYNIQAAKDAEKYSPERKAYFHLPGLFEHYDFYKKFLFVFYNYREFFYDWIAIGSIYGSPAYSIWNSGRERNTGTRDTVIKAKDLVSEYGISARFTFSNSLLEEKHLYDTYCNYLLSLFHDKKNGVILQSDLLKDYIKKSFPNYYFVSSVTKCLSNKEEMLSELANETFRFVVTDYNFNNDFYVLNQIPMKSRNKVELLIDEACAPNCKVRKFDYEGISKDSLYLSKEARKWHCPDEVTRPNKKNFSAVKKGKAFISMDSIKEKYLPLGFCNFKIEGRDYGELRLLEEILYYMVKPEFQLEVREMLYLTPWVNFPKEED